MSQSESIIPHLTTLIEDLDVELNEKEVSLFEVEQAILSDPESAVEIIEQLEVEALLLFELGQIELGQEPENPQPQSRSDDTAPYPVTDGVSTNNSRQNRSFQTTWMITLGVAASLVLGLGLFWMMQQINGRNQQVARNQQQDRDLQGQKKDPAHGQVDDIPSDLQPDSVKTDSKITKDKGSAPHWQLSVTHSGRTQSVQSLSYNLEFGILSAKGEGSTIEITTPTGTVSSDGGEFEIKLLPADATNESDVASIQLRVTSGSATLKNALGEVVVSANESATARRDQTPRLTEHP